MATIAELQSQLKSPTPQARWLAAWHLAQAGKEAAPALAEALEHADATVRYWAAVGLGNAGDKAAAGPLRAALKDESGDVGVAAAEALIRLGEQADGLGGLIAALNHPSEWVRLRALHAVKRLGPAAGDALDAARKAASGAGYPGRMAEHFRAENGQPAKGKEQKKGKRISP